MVNQQRMVVVGGGWGWSRPIRDQTYLVAFHQISRVDRSVSTYYMQDTGVNSLFVIFKAHNNPVNVFPVGNLRGHSVRAKGRI